MKLWKTETFFFGAVLAWLSQSHSYSQKKQALPLSSKQQGPVHYQKGCGSSSLTEDTTNQTPIQHRMKLNSSLGLSRSHCPPFSSARPLGSQFHCISLQEQLVVSHRCKASRDYLICLSRPELSKEFENPIRGWENGSARVPVFKSPPPM